MSDIEIYYQLSSYSAVIPTRAARAVFLAIFPAAFLFGNMVNAHLGKGRISRLIAVALPKPTYSNDSKSPSP
jgi:hypothetical protein